MSNVLRFSMVLGLLAMRTKGAYAQSQAPCFLQVQAEGGIDLPGATVWVDGEPVGTTNARGQWPWKPEMAGEVDHVLEVTSIGFGLNKTHSF